MNRYEFQVKLLRLLAGELSPDEIDELETQAAHHPRYAGELSALRGLDSLAGTAFRHIATPDVFTAPVGRESRGVGKSGHLGCRRVL